MVVTACLLMLAGMVMGSWSTADGGAERAARRARLQAFVSARHDLVTHPVRIVSATPGSEALAVATFEMARRVLETPSTKTILERLVVASAVAERAAAWPVLEPIVEALASARGTSRRFSLVGREVGIALEVAQLHAVDRRAWVEQVAWWEIACAVFERSQGEAFPCCFGGAWPDERLLLLDRATLSQLGEVVRGIESRTVVVDDPRVWLRPRVSSLLLPSVPPAWRDRLAAWAHGFDPYERERVAADELIAALPLLEKRDVPWPVRQADWRRFADCVQRGVGARLAGWADQSSGEMLRRVDLASLRLLRLVIAWRLGEPLPSLLDPFTLQPIVVEARGDGATFRCEAPGQVLVRHAARAFALESR